MTDINKLYARLQAVRSERHAAGREGDVARVAVLSELMDELLDEYRGLLED